MRPAVVIPARVRCVRIDRFAANLGRALRTEAAAARTTRGRAGMTALPAVIRSDYRRGDDAPPGPIEATFAAPGPAATTTTDIAGTDGKARFQIFHPTDLGAGERRLPIVTWGNGSKATPASYPGLLPHLASWGFVVIASTSRKTGTGAEILAGAQHLLAEDDRPGSPFAGRLDTRHVGAVGHSQGAGGVVRATIASAGLITTTVPINLPHRTWVSPGDEYDDLARIDGSVLLLTGALDLMAAGPGAMAGFYEELRGPAAMAALRGAGHIAVQGKGRRYLGYVTAWLRFQLAADSEAARAFTGPDAELLTNSNWTGQATKGLA